MLASNGIHAGGAGLPDFGIASAGRFGKLPHPIPAFGRVERDHAGSADLLVGPESPADVVFLHHLAEGGLPLGSVVAGFAHVHQESGLVAELDDGADGVGGRGALVAVAGVHDLVVKGPIAEDPEIAVPLRSSQEDDVVPVHFADGGDSPFMQGLEQGVELILIFKIGSDGLVDQFVAEDDGFVLVVGGDPLPDVAEQGLRGFAPEKPGIAVTVIDVGTGLSARGVVHVQDQVQAVFAAPIHAAVHEQEAVPAAFRTHVVFVKSL